MRPPNASCPQSTSSTPSLVTKADALANDGRNSVPGAISRASPSPKKPRGSDAMWALHDEVEELHARQILGERLLVLVDEHVEGEQHAAVARGLDRAADRDLARARDEHAGEM